MASVQVACGSKHSINLGLKLQLELDGVILFIDQLYIRWFRNGRLARARLLLELVISQLLHFSKDLLGPRSIQNFFDIF